MFFYVDYGGDDVMDVCFYPKSSNVRLNIYSSLCQLYFNKAIKTRVNIGSRDKNHEFAGKVV